MAKPTQLSLPFSSMSLRRVDPETNCFRFYALDIERDMFEQTLLARRLGRIGTYGRARFDEHPDEDSARSALAALVLAKQGRGYRDDFPTLRPSPNHGSDHDGLTLAPARVDEMIEPPLPF